MNFNSAFRFNLIALNEATSIHEELIRKKHYLPVQLHKNVCQLYYLTLTKLTLTKILLFYSNLVEYTNERFVFNLIYYIQKYKAHTSFDNHPIRTLFIHGPSMV